MKNNKERVLKYLTGLMAEDQKTAFENECKNSDELSHLIEKYRGNLSTLKEMGIADVDERYFINLLPGLMTRKEKRNRHSFIVRFVPVIPAVAVLIFILINVFYFDISIPYSYEKILAETIADSDSGTIDQLVSQYSASLIDEYLLDDETLVEYFETLDNSEVELSVQFNYQVTDNYYDYDDLSEDNIEIIYKSLLNKKIL